MDKLVRVDMSTMTASIVPEPASYDRLSGRALIARVLTDEVDPKCSPLGPNNYLILSAGIMSGLTLSSSNRISVGGKSPLTGTIKESNAGGTTCYRMARLGIKAIIVRGKPAEKRLYILKVGKDSAEILPADDLKGMGCYELSSVLRERFGQKVGIASIGPAGEMLMASACVANMDPEGRPSRVSGRGGLGAVMGSKGLKAIVVEDEGGTAPSVVNKEAYQAAVKALTDSLLSNAVVQGWTNYGTPGILQLVNHFGALPIKNFSVGQLENADHIAGERLRDIILERGGEGEPSHSCMPGCVIRCSNVFADVDGKEVVGPVEYETIGLVGVNCGIENFDAIARLNYLLNDLGIDTIEGGAAVAVAMEGGLLEFGDVEAFERLLGDIRQGTPVGRIIGAGATTVGRVFGVQRVAAVKGQAMPAYDPRTIKGVGTTYATSPMGADHTAGHTVRAKVDHLDPAPQAKLSAGAQVTMAAYDSLGMCMFSSAGVGPNLHLLTNIINGRYGWGIDESFIRELGRETLKLERAFNKRAGFSKAQDRIPEWMCTEALPPKNSVYDVSEEDIEALVEDRL